MIAIVPRYPLRILSTTSSAGFTLIELLVVVAVISASAMLAFGVVADDRGQMRYNETRNRLNSLFHATLGYAADQENGSQAGGFVLDNGELPETVSNLLTVPEGWLSRQAATPVFDPTPDGGSCANGGGTDDVALAYPGTQLTKGHRGNYLAGLSFNGRFRDGWGNQSASDDSSNFGWVVAHNASMQQLSFASLGNDNAAGGDELASDTVSTITANDWLVPLSSLNVSVTRRLTPATDTTRSFSVRLLVFRNDGAGGHWQNFSSTEGSLCLDGDGDGLVNGVPCPVDTRLNLAFTGSCTPGGAVVQARVPQGEHLLVLIEGNAVVRESSNNTTPVTTRVRLQAGALPPEARLELK